MKTLKHAVLAGFLCALMALPAQARAEYVYGFVNLSRVMHDCEAGQGLRKELEAKGQQFQAELSKENKTLSAERQQFEAARASLPKEQAAAQLLALESKYAAADRLQRDRGKTWSRAAAVANAEIKKATVDIILTLSKERNYAAVFSQDSVILAASEFDITDEVIKRLNQKMKKVSVDWSAKPPTGKN